MSKKIMDLIELAMQFKGNKTASVEFGSHINGVTVCVSLNGSIMYMKTCYLDWKDAEEKLENMKAELMEHLEQKEEVA